MAGYERSNLVMTEKELHNRSAGSMAAAALIFAGAVLLDQITKYMAASRLKPARRVSLIPSVLELQYLENRGAAFGMLENRQWIFILFACVIMAGCCIYGLRLPRSRKFLPMKLCLVFLSAGALGNMIDRIWHNYVIDFIYFSCINFPIFNVADIYVTVSVTVLVILVLFYYRDEDYEKH